MSYTTGRQKPPRSAINRNPPKPYGARLDGMARRAEEIALNRSRSLAGGSGRPRQQSSQVTGGPMVRIHLPPAESQQTFGSSNDARCSIA